MLTSIPIIDLAPALHGSREDRLRVAKEIEAVCTDTGFFTIRGHGVSLDLIRSIRGKASEFFNLPLEEKLKAQAVPITTPRGYRAFGLESLGRGNGTTTLPDLKEYYHFGRENWPQSPYYTSEEGQRYFIPNIWPETPAGFGDVAERYYAEMERLTGEMMKLAALALGIDENFFEDKIDRHITAMRINFYPAQSEIPPAGQQRLGEHTDYGLLTILNGENVGGGLEVQTLDGRWIQVETEPDTFVVNIGDLLMRWTNDRWISNLHRVANPPRPEGSAQRISIAFFHHPNYNAQVECIAPPGEAKYPPVLSGDYRDTKYRQTRV
jgi:isopenicillin N synthase-like dioxygenase